MPTFNSSITNKKIPNAPLREYDVPDESDGHKHEEIEENAKKLAEFQEKIKRQQQQEREEEIIRQMQLEKESKQKGVQRLSEGAVRRIEILIGMTRTIHTVEIEGNIYSFRSLRSKEMRDAILAASDFNGIQSTFEIRRQLLARSMLQVAGVDIDQFIGSSDLESKLAFIDEMDDALLTRLYDEYVKLAKEASNKYSVKTEEQVKEVVEDLKK